MDKDSEQDAQLKLHAERINRNEEAIKRQTEALEQIRDHYYPPPIGFWKKAFALVAKCCCVVFAYLGIAETVDWIWASRESGALAKKYADAGKRFFIMESDPDAAMKCYEKAMKLEPKNSNYMMSYSYMKNLSLCAGFLNAERSLTENERILVNIALTEATAMKDIVPDNPIPHILMAQSLILRGELKEAKAEIVEAIKDAPNEAAVRVSACAINYYAGDSKAAREQLFEAERLNPELPIMLVWKGLLTMKVDNDAVTARRYLEQVTQIAPRFAIAYSLLGKALLACDKPDVIAARAAFHKAITLNAKLKVAMLGIAETYKSEGKLEVAQIWLDKVLSCDPNNLLAYIAKAEICNKTGDNKTASKCLNAAIELSPFRADLYRKRADVSERMNGNVQSEFKPSRDRQIAEELEREVR